MNGNETETNLEQHENDSLNKELEEKVTGSEFEKYILFTNKEIPIDEVTPRYCPNTIENDITHWMELPDPPKCDNCFGNGYKSYNTDNGWYDKCPVCNKEMI
jgi:hypothetical protein